VKSFRIFALLTLAWWPGLADAQARAVPIERRENLILVRAKVQGVEGIFILDTGAQNSMVAPELVFDVKERRQTNVQGIAGTSKVDAVRVTIQLGGSFLSTRVLVLPMDAQSKRLNERISGILGMDFLGQYERIVLDLKGLTMTLTEGAK